MSRPLPKSLQKVIVARFSDRVEEGWSEQDGFSERRDGWSHWIYLKPGWRNFILDPGAPLHAIHEDKVNECIRQLRGAKPCDCEECERDKKS